MTGIVAGNAPPGITTPEPDVRAITVDDISAALSDGLRDFRAAPAFGLLIGAVYAIAGNVLFWVAASFDFLFLAYPLAAGFALVAPFAAVGIYETSRRLAIGGDVSIGALAGSVPPHARRELGYMALVTAFGMIAWVYAAGFVYALFFGISSLGETDIVTAIVSTGLGIAFLVTGALIGAVMATVIFSVSVVSFPLLLDRDVDFITAMITSVKAVVVNPKTMIVWAAIVSGLMVLAVLPAFLGLFVVLPVLGHTSWHLYRKLVAPEEAPAPAA